MLANRGETLSYLSVNGSLFVPFQLSRLTPVKIDSSVVFFAIVQKDGTLCFLVLQNLIDSTKHLLQLRRERGSYDAEN